jgi:hypothetical protein
MLALSQIINHVLLNRFYMKVMVKNCQDLSTMIRSMIGKVEKDFPTRVG